MGLLFSRAWRAILSRSNRRFKIVIVGLNNAGKTTILYKLNMGSVIQTVPTIGCNVEEVHYKNITFQVWDVGGQESMRNTWPFYFEQTAALIFVMDSNAYDNVVVAKLELFNALLSERLQDAPLLVLANKQDVASARAAAEIAMDLNLTSIKDRDWHIQACSGLTGEGLYEGLDWVAKKLGCTDD
eukprot:Selendium_serpulae@DN5983_c0_g2_i1.p1